MNTHFIIPSAVSDVITRLNSAGKQAFLVGGCVRDHLLNLIPNDYDVASSALPCEVMQIFSDFTVVPTGLKHGTVTVVTDIGPIEITTFRRDGAYTDSRHPNNVEFADDFKDDAPRRDFTMNAMGYHPLLGVIDYFGGIDDINSRTIRAVGDADTRFNEDALRILRAVRFSSQLGFEIEEKTKASVFKNKNLLSNVSPERLYVELIKLLCGDNVLEVLCQYHSVLEVFIPEIAPMVGLDQHNFHHIYDVWTHTAHAVASAPKTPVLRLAAFFHDIGKPHTFSLSNDGTGHFYGHSAVGCELASNILKRLRCDNQTHDKVLTLIKYHDLQIPEDKNVIRKHLSKLSPEVFFDLLDIFRADNLAISPEFRDRQMHYNCLENIAREILQEKPCLKVKDLEIRGNDLMSLGLSPSREMGRILNELLDDVLCDKIKNEKHELINRAEELIIKSIKD